MRARKRTEPLRKPAENWPAGLRNPFSLHLSPRPKPARPPSLGPTIHSREARFGISLPPIRTDHLSRMTTAMRILLVDDDPAGAELTAAALQELGYGAGVSMASDGEEALDFLFRRGPFNSAPETPPAVVLLDLKMPKVDGHEVLRQIRADPRLRRTRVVVLTSSDQEADIKRSRELGSDAYLVKPTSIVELIDQLGRLTPQWHQDSAPAAPTNP